MLTHIILSLSFQRIKTQTEIRKLSIRRRPERGWPRGDHSVHDERRCERREVMLLSPLFENFSIWICFSSFSSLRSSRSALCVCTCKRAGVYVRARLRVLVSRLSRCETRRARVYEIRFSSKFLFFPTAKWELNWRPDRFCALSLSTESAFNTDFCLSLI